MAATFSPHMLDWITKSGDNWDLLGVDCCFLIIILSSDVQLSGYQMLVVQILN